MSEKQEVSGPIVSRRSLVKTALGLVGLGTAAAVVGPEAVKVLGSMAETQEQKETREKLESAIKTGEGLTRQLVVKSDLPIKAQLRNRPLISAAPEENVMSQVGELAPRTLVNNAIKVSGTTDAPQTKGGQWYAFFNPNDRGEKPRVVFSYSQNFDIPNAPRFAEQSQTTISSSSKTPEGSKP